MLLDTLYLAYLLTIDVFLFGVINTESNCSPHPYISWELWQ